MVHLEGQPYKPEQRFNQLRSLLQKAEAAGVHPRADALVLVGDFNSGPEESAYAYLVQGSLPAGCLDRGVLLPSSTDTQYACTLCMDVFGVMLMSLASARLVFSTALAWPRGDMHEQGGCTSASET